MIRRARLRQPEAGNDVTIVLWQRLAAELVTLIGEGGFQSLYARSLKLERRDWPWLAADDSMASGFAGLKASLQARPPGQAASASSALLGTLIDLLALLIGEQLTINLLRTAWGSETAGALDLASS